jgi:hypothetical protein
VTSPPTIDDFDEEEIFETLIERADVYTDTWDPTTSDTGRTILRIFSTFEADMRNRLNSVPQKHRMAFLDALGFDQRPPKAARVPLTFHVPSDLDRNVIIPGGTQVLSEGNDSSQLFEVPHDHGFEATGATLTDIVAVDPSADTITDHSEVLEDGSQVELFTGNNEQKHHLYVASEETLNLNPGSLFSVTADIDIDNDTFSESVVWEYYGKDSDGKEGWHRLHRPQTGPDVPDDGGIEAVKQEIQSQSSEDMIVGDVANTRTGEEIYKETFQLPGTIMQYAVNGVESRWLRCRLIDATPELFSTSVRDLALHVGSTEDESGLEPDCLLSNDVPLSSDNGVIKPLGEFPQPPSSFYLACEEALTKPGGTVTLAFESPTGDTETIAGSTDGTDTDRSDSSTDLNVMSGDPRLSWEYWNGDGWVQLSNVEDGTNTFYEAGSVTFRIPSDIEPTTVSGIENVWIRARLVSGDYGRPSIDVPNVDGLDGFTSELTPPVFGDISVQYEHQGQSFDTAFCQNNVAYSDDLTDNETAYTPFQDLPEAEQTVYFGFDDTLHDGPITVFVPVEDTTYPQSFDPGMEWEYCTSPTEHTWTEIDVRDRTGGFTERGIVSLTFPESTTPVELFGRRRHWIRVRATQDEFDQSLAEKQQSAQNRTVADSTGRTTAPPVIDGLYVNTRWAYNKRTIENEILGSSDGSHEQLFQCAHAPMLSIDVWVDEQSRLSAGERRTLLEERPEDVERTFDDRGDLSAFWVRWRPVDDFLDSGPTDRHYIVDKTLGTVGFGDGDNGAIPPSGKDNIRATYATGGGRDGNVGAGTVTDLKSPISLVDNVTNPIDADGGADAESIDAVVSRSASRIKHRSRAITPADYEQVALAEFRELATVKCETTTGDGETRVTVLVVPETDRDKPVPSMTLKHDVRSMLSDHAPATVVESDDIDIVVRGPGYAEVSIETTVRAPAVKSVSLLKQRVRQELDTYLHPLTGKDGEGWDFGELPAHEDIVSLIDKVETVDEPVGVTISVEVNGERHVMMGRSGNASLPSTVLVCSGDHELRVTTEETTHGH